MRKVLLIVGLVMGLNCVNAQCWKAIAPAPTASHTIAIAINGSLWAWGWNIHGQLGNGNTSNKNSPFQIGNDTDWQSVACGSGHTIAIKTNGTLWAWGNNYTGQLGIANNISQNSPLQIDSATDWHSVVCGYSHTIAIKTNGTLWAWGYNNYGQLGNGNTMDLNSPMQIGSDSNWQSVACGGYHTAATKTDGTLWTWGWNQFGQLGNGNSGTNEYSPMQIGSDANWQSIACGGFHTAGTKTNGTLWTWGNNQCGQLGNGNSSTDESSPFQIGNSTNWKTVAGADCHTTAIKTDSTLWAWGYNVSGQLGNGNTTNQSSPIQIGSASNWKLVVCGGYYSVAINNNHTLWSWGFNKQGQLGVGNYADQHSPVSIACPSALPLKLLSFNAKQETRNNVLLNWQTTNELNVSHINIQRSNNGKDFENIGKVNAGGVSSYSFLDSKLPITNDKLTLYYRLEIVDKDGSKTYSEIKQVAIGNKQLAINIYPNPAKDVVKIECADARKLLIIDNLGRIVYNKVYQSPSFGGVGEAVNCKPFAKDIYTVQVTFANGEIKNEKLLVE